MKVGSLVERVPTTREISSSDRTQADFVKSQGYAFPIIGNIYTVRDIVHYPAHNRIGLLLEEIVNPKIWTGKGFVELGFDTCMFRELQPPMDLTELLQECNELVNI